MPYSLTSLQPFIEFDDEIFSDLRITFGTSFLGLGVTDMNMLHYQGPEEELSAKRRWLRKLLLRLTLEFDTLPSSMTVQVMNVSEECLLGGGYADIYEGRYNGKVIALKRFRLLPADITTQKIRVQCCYTTLMVIIH